MVNGDHKAQSKAAEEKSKDEMARADIRESRDKEDVQHHKEKPLEKMTKAELMEKIAEIQEEAKRNYDLYLRSQADIENLKKRNSKERAELAKYANESLVKELLPVVDNLELAISHARSNNSLSALREGVELTLKGLKDTLVKSGLEEIGALNRPFDPNYHHAVSEREDDGVEPGTVLEEMQKGYLFNQRLIRPAMVVVSRGRASGEGDRGEGVD
ncbi:MAG: nucleotide exchange factor GrpE [Deltaproteobacteria bacterium]|nr:nucleotide exchange factor GrpE [Deltaproteobacteria bacterium]MBW2138645.1 nucleotide exchange factor GrpE [Deltaproteobacteria bacterium]